RRIRGGVDDDVLIALKHRDGVDSYLSVSAIAGAPGPRVRMHGRNGTFIAKELDPQEALLRSGVKPLSTGWSDTAAATGEFRIHKGPESFNHRGIPGNYVNFYNQVKDSLSTGSALPISREFALEVAQILDRAREIDIRSNG
ncbi:MAG: dehydrogenase, partial [Actinobacteria bacterium]|nr:dehydrogenase [Actinomycetota bacterium]